MLNQFRCQEQTNCQNHTNKNGNQVIQSKFTKSIGHKNKGRSKNSRSKECEEKSYEKFSGKKYKGKSLQKISGENTGGNYLLKYRVKI